MAEKIDDDLWDQCRLVAANATEHGAYPQTLGQIDEFTVLICDGNQVKVAHSMDFHEAGNGLGWEKDFIPKSEIWLDSTVTTDQHKFNLYHELFECRLMKKGLTYDAAHDRANAAERILRRRWGNNDPNYRE